MECFFFFRSDAHYSYWMIFFVISSCSRLSFWRGFSCFTFLTLFSHIFILNCAARNIPTINHVLCSHIKMLILQLCCCGDGNKLHSYLSRNLHGIECIFTMYLNYVHWMYFTFSSIFFMIFCTIKWVLFHRMNDRISSSSVDDAMVFTLMMLRL